ncbi:thioredoxin domain-containing protein [Tsukamurella sp. 8F]|uniref:DsbA family protein n=1 Tax=unclassified Tsukamurella TaxID=2633480 RepID=UPI0023B8CDA6|nr:MULTISPECIES: thioredoxin domain-containing protein [unclassified Tsukamurella]MDF0528823.1 thioredoxin domain-containing protein [Tsukamurella sp. 8J]MDF0586658.1 thioredoxin domain-containing protein [Tsukamurella sp. 8F]
MSNVPKMKKGKGGGYVPTKQSNTLAYVLGGVAIVVIIAVLGFFLWHNSNSSKNQKAGDKAAAVAQLSKSATFTAGKPDAKTTVDIFSDFQCPYCAQLEQQSGAEISKAVDDGSLQVRYHIVNFLDENSASGDYSSRTAGAMIAIAKSSMAADLKQKAWMATYAALYAKQPKEKAAGGSSDWANADIAKIAAEASQGAGAALPADVTKAITDGADAASGKSSASAEMQLLQQVGGQGTPTVLHDGAPVDALGNPGWLSGLLK